MGWYLWKSAWGGWQVTCDSPAGWYTTRQWDLHELRRRQGGACGDPRVRLRGTVMGAQLLSKPTPPSHSQLGLFVTYSMRWRRRGRSLWNSIALSRQGVYLRRLFSWASVVWFQAAPPRLPIPVLFVTQEFPFVLCSFPSLSLPLSPPHDFPLLLISPWCI